MNIVRPTGELLVLPPRPDSTGQLLAASALRRGLAVEQLAGPVVPAQLRGVSGVHLYGGPLFAGAVAADLNLALLEPDDDWLAATVRVPPP